MMTEQTKEETKFIRRIGNHSLVANTVGRSDILKGYIAGSEKRQQWDGIDRSIAIATAALELAIEESNSK